MSVTSSLLKVIQFLHLLPINSSGIILPMKMKKGLNFAVNLLKSFVFGALGALFMSSVREHFSFTVTLIVLVVVITVAFFLDGVWKRHKKKREEE
ncbi:hypothetical protein [Bacillus cabrialesii]